MNLFGKILPLCLLLLLLPAPAAGEPAGAAFTKSHADFFRLYYPERSDIDIYYRHDPEGEAEDGPGSYRLHLFGVGGEVPHVLSRDGFLRLGGVYDLRRYDVDDVSSEALDVGTLSLHRLSATVGAGYFLNDSLLLSAAVMPGVYTDFSDTTDTDAFELKAEALLVVRINYGAQLILGATRTLVDNDRELLPLLGLRLLSEDGRFNIALTFPHELRAGYSLAPQLQLYGGAWAHGDRYRAEIDDESLDIELEERRLGIGLQWFASRHISFAVEGGALLDSKFELETELEAPFTDGDLEPTPYVAAVIGISL